MLALRGVGTLEIEVERDHPPLDVEVLDDDMIALDLEHRRGDGQELGQELVGKAIARKGDVRILENVRHPADAIVVLDEPVFRP